MRYRNTTFLFNTEQSSKAGRNRNVFQTEFYFMPAYLNPILITLTTETNCNLHRGVPF